MLDGDKFAQQISDRIFIKSEKEYEINQATLYSCLKRLESLQYVASYWHDVSDGRRKYFKLTEKGKEAVDFNLSSWNYSRAIIDKLIDAPETEKVVKTYVIPSFSAAESQPVETQPVEAEEGLNKPQETKNETFEEKSDFGAATQNTEQNTVRGTENIKNEYDLAAEKELNFRNILNGMIKLSKQSDAEIIDEETENVKNTEKDEPELKKIPPLNREDVKSEPQKSEDFNKQIEKSYSTKRFSYEGQIDYSDLESKAVAEGYKVRISAKEIKVSTGSVLINKVNLFAASILFILLVGEYLTFTQGFGTVLELNLWVCYAILAAFVAIPIIAVAVFLKKPFKTVKLLPSESVRWLRQLRLR